MTMKKMLLLTTIIVLTITSTLFAQSPVEAIREPFTQQDLNVLVGNVQRPNGIIWLDDYLYVVCNGDWTVYEIESNTGATQTYIFGIRDSHELYAEETENGFNLWIPDFATNRLYRVDQTRSAPTIITSQNLESPWGITAIEEHFLITNIRANNIVEINREGEIINLIEGFRSPAGITSDEEYVYVVNNGSARRSIEWFKISDLEEETVEPKPLVSGLQNTSNITIGVDGQLYFTYALGTRGVVGRINPESCLESGCTNDEVEILIFTDLPAPLAGLTLSPDMRLFIHTIYRPEIYWVQLQYDASGSTEGTDEQ